MSQIQTPQFSRSKQIVADHMFDRKLRKCHAHTNVIFTHKLSTRHHHHHHHHHPGPSCAQQPNHRSSSSPTPEVNIIVLVLLVLSKMWEPVHVLCSSDEDVTMKAFACPRHDFVTSPLLLQRTCTGPHVLGEIGIQGMKASARPHHDLLMSSSP